jgi:NAD(P)-dependent dehydrogenase (short-subunit alcohol dehydrogenase family)
MVLYLASDESQWVTGTAMIVDGGLTVGPDFPQYTRAAAQAVQTHYTGPSFKR